LPSAVSVSRSAVSTVPSNFASAPRVPASACAMRDCTTPVLGTVHEISGPRL
jgi:hypothetical protein